jgi:hypothetical protein
MHFYTDGHLSRTLASAWCTARRPSEKLIVFDEGNAKYLIEREQQLLPFNPFVVVRGALLTLWSAIFKMWRQGDQKKGQETNYKLSGSRTHGPPRSLTIERVHSAYLLPLSPEFHKYE